MQITKDAVLSAQKAWGAAIVELGAMKEQPRAELEARLEALLNQLYAYDTGPVLFKPTKAAEVPFRKHKVEAASYFIGGNELLPEDQGFAMMPWTAVRFENHAMIIEENRAIAMGHYYFKDISETETKVEYTFGYRADQNGHLKIDLHHSSLPFSG